MAPPSDSYMVISTPQEPQRLNNQHELVRQISNGRLIHSSLPLNRFRTVADVATGTGIWLQETAAEVRRIASKGEDSTKLEFVGFDISAQEFPAATDLEPDVSFVVHDITEAFPQQYHEKFDLVNVRFISYAIKAVDLEKVVGNVLQILRPGGCLQWQETDTCDWRTIPEDPLSTAILAYITSERIALGLPPATVTPLLKAIQSHSTQPSDWRLNPISWSSQLMRIIHLEIKSTHKHLSPALPALKGKVLLAATTALLQSAFSRKKAVSADPMTTSLEKEKLGKEIGEVTGLIEAIQRGGDGACNHWEMEVTLIVARKAVVVKQNESWMSVKYPA